MKKLLLILFCMPMIGFGQQLTYVPDDNFEQALINLGYDGVLDNYIYTSMANTITDLTIYGSGPGGSAVGQIYDLTGIEDMPITHLELYNLDSISSMDFSMLPDLIYLKLLGFDELETINISNNLNLVEINLIHASSLLSIDVSNNLNLKRIQITYSPISSLDLSNNPLYGGFSGVNLQYNTNLSSLNLRNGYNTYMNPPYMNGNSQLYCIDVDDWEYSLLNWGFVEPQITYSNNCSSGTDINDYQQNRKIYKVTNLLGKETKGIKNEFLFYIYDDGTVEKRIVIE